MRTLFSRPGSLSRSSTTVRHGSPESECGLSEADYHCLVSDAYDFSTSGPGQYVFTMKNFNTFYYVADGKISALVGGSGHTFHTVNVAGNARSYKDHAHRHAGGYCEAWQERAIDAAIPLAEKYVNHAIE